VGYHPHRSSGISGRRSYRDDGKIKLKKKRVTTIPPTVTNLYHSRPATFQDRAIEKDRQMFVEGCTELMAQTNQNGTALVLWPTTLSEPGPPEKVSDRMKQSFCLHVLNRSDRTQIYRINKINRRK
jgi:hypothetical protein